jgi:hypothetical protein
VEPVDLRREPIRGDVEQRVELGKRQTLRWLQLLELDGGEQFSEDHASTKGVEDGR